MIDVLDEEEGLIEGPKPLFIGGTGELDMPHFDQFMINVKYVVFRFPCSWSQLIFAEAVLRSSLGTSNVWTSFSIS